MASTAEHRVGTADPRDGRAGLAPFLVITFGFTWGLWLVAGLLGGDVSTPAVLAVFAVGACGPSVAALACRLAGRPGARLARLRSGRRWLPAALVLGVAPAAVAALLAPLVGGPQLDPALVRDTVAGAGGPLLFAVTALVAGPLAEEFGWRGHAQPRLRRSLPPGRTALVLGAVWAVWHVPLFFLAGTWQSGIGLFTPQGLLFLVAMVPLSHLHWFVSERLRGGVPAAVLLHLAGNVSLTLLVADFASAGGFFVAAVAALVVVVAVAARAGGG